MNRGQRFGGGGGEVIGKKQEKRLNQENIQVDGVGREDV